MYSRGKRIFITDSPIDQEQQPLPIYPFNIDFTAKKKKQSQFRPIHSQPNQHILTQTSSSHHYSDEQFQTYSQQSHQHSFIDQESIPEDSQLQTYSIHNLTETNTINEDSYENLSQSCLRKLNEKMVILKEELRRIARKYTHNASILARQRAELQKLRGKKSKALDYQYELELSQQQVKKRVQSQAVSGSINKAATLIKKLRYKRIKESGKAKDPFDSRCLLQDSRMTVDQSDAMMRLQSTREEVLCKLRQQENNTQLLEALKMKEKEYLRIIDIDNGQLCKGDTASLGQRVQFLSKELEIKQEMIGLKQQQVQLEIASLKAEISAVDFKIDRADRSLREKELEKEERRVNVTQIKRSSKIKAKKNSYHLIKSINPFSPREYSKISQAWTPKAKGVVAFPRKVQHGPTTIKKVIFHHL